MNKLKILIVGAGDRGSVYANLIQRDHTERAQVVGVVEPRDHWRTRMAEKHGIPAQNVFSDWREPLTRERFADAVIIATPDRLHTEPAVAYAELGYHILLEKPMAPTEDECSRIVDAVQSAGVHFAVCHVLRYTRYTQQLKQLIQSGRIGEPVTIQHLEPVGYAHQAHSFVRGNWGNSKASCFMLLAKSCHDLDWIAYVMGTHAQRVSSFGSLQHFRPECAPEGATERCLDCPMRGDSSENSGTDPSRNERPGLSLEFSSSTGEQKPVVADCPYSAVKIYLEPARKGETEWPVNIITDDLTPEGVERALREGPYGRCAYQCDNDVVDHQVVNFEFAGGATGVFTMTAFTEMHQQRKTQIFGTHGQLTGDGDSIELVDFRNDITERYEELSTNDVLDGHAGADAALIDAFVTALAEDDLSQLLSGPAETLATHRSVFAAERARVEGCVISL